MTTPNLPPSLTPSNNSHPIDELKRQDPHEALGLEMQPSLLRATVEAVVLTVMLVALFTIGPYAYARFASKSEPAKSEPAASQEQPREENPAKPTETGKAADTTPPATAGVGQPAIDKGTLDRLGIGETKTGTPTFNPLDGNKADDLLKDLDK